MTSTYKIYIILDENCCEPTVIQEDIYSLNYKAENTFSPYCLKPDGTPARWLTANHVNNGKFTINYCKVRYASGFEIQNSFNAPAFDR